MRVNKFLIWITDIEQYAPLTQIKAALTVGIVFKLIKSLPGYKRLINFASKIICGFNRTRYIACTRDTPESAR